MNLIQFSIRNRLFFNLLTFFLIIAGILTALKMKREAFPNVQYDIVSITTSYQGASPAEVEKLVTIPLEEKLIEVDDIKEMLSVSSEGISVITMTLDPDAPDKDRVVNDIQTAVDNTNDLPDDLEDDPIVKEFNTRDRPAIQISLSGNLDEHDLQKYAEILEDRILDIEGVARINRSGWREKEIWVEADPDKLDEYHFSLEDIIVALRNRNLNLPGGTIKKDREEFLVRTVGEFETSDEVRKVIVRANDQGNWVEVGDLARVIDTFEDEDIIHKTNGTRSINLQVVKRGSGDVIRVVNAIRVVLDEFKEQVPTELKVSIYDDISFYVKRRLNVLLNNGIYGVFFVLICLMLFLRPSVALATAFGIPFTILAAIMVMSLLGLTINLLSMFGLIIVLGMIVDDAIVVGENSYRLIEEGLEPEEAVIKGATAMLKPVTTTILTTIVVFLPLMFMTGIFGQFIRAIPQVVIIVLVLSLFEAFFILPSHIIDFVGMNRKGKGSSLKSKWIKKFMFPFHTFSSARNALGRRCAQKYETLLIWSVKKRYLLFLLMIMMLVGSVVFQKKFMKTILFPKRGIEIFSVKAKAPVGTALKLTAEQLSLIEKAIEGLPKNEIDTYVTTVGLMSDDGRSMERGSHVGQIVVYLTPPAERVRKADEIIADLKTKVKNHDFFDHLTFSQMGGGPPVGKPVAAKIRGKSFDELLAVAERIKSELSNMNGVIDIEDDYNEGKGEYRVIVNEKEALRTGLSVQQIAQSVRNMFDGGIATTIRKGKEEIDVVVRFPEHLRQNPSNFEKLLIPNEKGNLIPFYSVAKIEQATGLMSIKHYDRKKVVTVSAEIDDEITSSMIVNTTLQEKSINILREYPNVLIKFGGENEDTQESLESLRHAFVIALIMVFLILATTFNSLLQPAIVILAIPFGFVGVVFALYFHGEPFSFLAFLGMVGLSGVVINDSIILVDYINQLRKQGLSLFDAVIQGGKTRLRPVVLTTLTTIIGLAPVAYGLGGLDPFLRPMAITISWGLAFGTIIILGLVPCLYFTFAGASND
ncbi:efflux RND transporter permease subunit [PVC group bacterium]|nr:efflux RND transporter permease subunit [PVC group bacterium]